MLFDMQAYLWILWRRIRIRRILCIPWRDGCLTYFGLYHSSKCFLLHQQILNFTHKSHDWSQVESVPSKFPSQPQLLYDGFTSNFQKALRD